MSNGLQVINTEVNEANVLVDGLFEGKPFAMNYFFTEDGFEAITTVDGEFSDYERMQIVVVWEIEGLQTEAEKAQLAEYLVEQQECYNHSIGMADALANRGDQYGDQMSLEYLDQASSILSLMQAVAANPREYDLVSWKDECR